jgi:hypothetical protein
MYQDLWGNWSRHSIRPWTPRNIVPQKRLHTSTHLHGFATSRNPVQFQFPAIQSPCLTSALITYRSGDYKDELVWGAVWLYRATNDNSYLSTAEQLYNEFGLQNWNGGFTWDQKISGLEVRYLEKFTIPVRLSLTSLLSLKTLNHRTTVRSSFRLQLRVHASTTEQNCG